MLASEGKNRFIKSKQKMVGPQGFPPESLMFLTMRLRVMSPMVILRRISDVTLGKALNHVASQLPHLQNEDNNTGLSQRGVVWIN